MAGADGDVMSTKPEECVNYLAPFRAEPRNRSRDIRLWNWVSRPPRRCSTYRRKEKACFLARFDHIACFPSVVYTSSVLVAAANIWLIWCLGFNIQRYPYDQQQRHPKHPGFTYATCTKMLCWKYRTSKCLKSMETLIQSYDKHGLNPLNI